MISNFSCDNRFLSNFWLSPVMVDDLSFPTVEHAYQASKTLNRSERVVIAFLATAAMAKSYGQKVKLRSDWKSVQVGIMEDLVRQKFQHPKLRERLLDTGTQSLVEGNNWGDTFWGVCRGKGENHLGKILMKIREELRHAQAA